MAKIEQFLTDPAKIGPDGFPIVLGESIRVERLPFLEIGDEKEREKAIRNHDIEAVTRARNVLFQRMESRRRIEEARRLEPLHYECFETFAIVREDSIEVVIGSHIHREQKGEGVLDENLKYVVFDDLRAEARRERGEPCDGRR